MPRIPSPISLLPALLLATACSSPPPTSEVPDLNELTTASPPETPGELEPFSALGNPPNYVALGVRYTVLDSAEGYVEQGLASWYGPNFHEQMTSNGEIFDMYRVSAAHKTLPLPSWVEVTHLGTGETLTLRVNDRGPFKQDRIIDLSYQAAKLLGTLQEGVAPVEVRVIQGPRKELKYSQDTYLQLAAFSSKANAIAYREKLALQGLSRISIRARIRNSPLYRVLYGPLNNHHDMQQAIARLHRLGITTFTPIAFPYKT